MKTAPSALAARPPPPLLRAERRELIINWLALLALLALGLV